MKKLSYNSLLIVILVCVVFTYMIIMLDEKTKKVKEMFSSVDGSIMELEEFTENGTTTSTTDTTAATTDTTTGTTSTTDTTTGTTTSTTDTTAATTGTTTDNSIVEADANGSGDAGSNTDAVSEESSQNIVQTPDKKTTIVHNHYYGGNKEIAKFLGALADQQQQQEQNELVDQGMCSELNNKLGNKTLAEIKNDRLLFDLKNKCDKYAYSESTCKVAPTQDQTALLGTLLGDAKNTQFGSIVAR